jgi:hypothetical protein
MLKLSLDPPAKNMKLALKQARCPPQARAIELAVAAKLWYFSNMRPWYAYTMRR